MSHATVMVVLPEAPASMEEAEHMITDLMAPFDEEIRVDAYKNYYPKPEDLNGKYIPYPYGYIKREHPEIIDDLQAIADLLNNDEKQWGVDEDGLYSMSTYNPNAKWDWWVIGGRWRGHYAIKPKSEEDNFVSNYGGVFDTKAEPGCADVCTKGSISKHTAEQRAIKHAKDAWKKAQSDDLVKDNPGMLNYIYGIQAGDTEADVIARAKENCWPPSHYAVLTADGEWNEPGHMGWFGMSSETDSSREIYDKWYKDFWDSLSNDTWIACVDYHI